MKLKHIFYAIIFIGTGLQAQERDLYGELVPGIKELHIGDKVPDILIDKIINNDKRSFRTSDYKDRLLVLDFWGISCTTCIENMPKLDSLQRVFGDKIKLLSVTYQPEELISEFLKTNRYLNNRKIPVHRPSVVEDKLLRSYFRYKTNPHVVWIYKGKVTAITGYEYITKENIQEILDGKSVNWKLKDDNFDPGNASMLLDGVFSNATASPFYSHSVLTGETNSSKETAGINFEQDTIQNRTRVALYDSDIYGAYQMLLFATKPKGDPLYLPHPNRRVIEVKDPSRLEYRSKYGNQPEWNRKNLISYEQVKYGLVDKIEMAKLAVQDLNNRLGLNGRYEMRKVKCLVFVSTGKQVTDTLAVEKGGMSIPALVIMRLDMQRIYPPAIDETGFKGALRMEPDDGTIAGLQKEMQRHGLDLIEAEREIEVIVISEKD